MRMSIVQVWMVTTRIQAIESIFRRLLIMCMSNVQVWIATTRTQTIESRKAQFHDIPSFCAEPLGLLVLQAWLRL